MTLARATRRGPAPPRAPPCATSTAAPTPPPRSTCRRLQARPRSRCAWRWRSRPDRAALEAAVVLGGGRARPRAVRDFAGADVAGAPRRSPCDRDARDATAHRATRIGRTSAQRSKLRSCGVTGARRAHERGGGAPSRVVRRDPAGAPVRLAKKTSNLFRPARRDRAPGLDVSGLDGVIAIDAAARTADVQGMCTYEHLVDATLPHGLIPYVVPQLRTITLGGAVTGLGIESTSFRNGLPHESVSRWTSSPAPARSSPTRPGRRPVRHLPQLLRLARLRHPAADRARAGAVVRRPAPRPLRRRRAARQDDRRDHRDPGVRRRARRRRSTASRSQPGEYYLTLATLDRRARRPTGDATPSDYTGQQIYYRSIQQRETDLLTMYDYLWRWDTDWFWCSRRVRRPAPRRPPGLAAALASAPTSTTGWSASTTASTSATWLDRRAGNPEGERVVQDVEIPVERLPEFLDWFDAEVGMRPVWLCPLVARPAKWPDATRSRPGEIYVNVGFWGNVARRPRRAERARATARSRRRCTSSAATSRSTPRRSTTARRSTSCTTAPTWRAVKEPVRPRRPADQPLRQGGEETMTGHAEDRRRFRAADPGPAAPALHGVRRQRERPRGRAVRLRPAQRARPGLPDDRARRPRPRPGLRHRRPRRDRRPPGRPLRRRSRRCRRA